MKPQQIEIAAVAAADRFFSARPWQRVESDDVFAIELASGPEIAGVVLGSAGREHGLSLLLGPRAVEEMRAISDGEIEISDATSRALWFTLTKRQQIEPPFDRALVHAKRAGRTAPLFMAMDPGQPPRPPKADEFELLIVVMQVLAIADERSGLDLAPSTAQMVPTLIVRSAGERTEVQLVERAAPTRTVEPHLRLVSTAAPPELAGLPRLGCRYAATVARVPMVIKGADQESRVLLVLDIDEDQIAALEILEGDALPAAQERLLALFANGSGYAERGLPATLILRDRAFADLVGPGLRGAGVDCRYEPDVPELDAILASLSDHLHGLADEAGRAAPDFTPETDDLDGWKQIDYEASQVLAERGANAALDSDKAWRRYLGARREQLASTMRVFEDSLVTGYLDYYFHCYRATAKSRTIVERVLADELPAAVRDVITAREAAALSLYRIEAIDTGEGVQLLDLLTGRRHEVTDEALSLSGREGLTFAGRVYRVGGFEFAMAVSPAIPAVRAAAAMRFLEAECGLQLDDPIDARAAHLLGRLWAWSERPMSADAAFELRDEEVPATAASTPEAALEVMYMRWLDTPVPDLGGRTPREACRDPAGRRRVARMIRAYPDPIGVEGVQAPRAKMLAELGLLEREAGDQA